MKTPFQQISIEVAQDHVLRKPLLEKISELRGGRAIISFFISFHSRSPLSQEDADMIEEVLSGTDTSKGITLLLDAPGGDGLAAERIIQVCKKYSGNDFETLVPSRAKSAATMVCLGSDRILMAPTSELGPIDPQIPIKIGDSWRWGAAHHVIRTYDDLVTRAATLKGGNIEPYLQQLAQFNATEIEMFRAATKLAENIAVKSLRKGMMKGETEATIKKRITCFTDPEVTLSHGRALNPEHLQDCKLVIEEIDVKSEFWRKVRELYSRSKFLVDRSESSRKLLETVETSFQAG